MGAYKYPESHVDSGRDFVLLVMGLVSPDIFAVGQKAYWATMVGTNISHQVPVLGPYIAKILKGGEEMGAVTLTRFFAIHVLILPLITGAVVGVHLFLVVWHGISEAPSRDLHGDKK